MPSTFTRNYTTKTEVSRMTSFGSNRYQKEQSEDSGPNKLRHIPPSSIQAERIHKCGKPWKTSQKNKVTNDEELLKKARGILNKITPQKLESLVEQMRNLAINTEKDLVRVMELVFEKAIDEPKFSVSYATMCKYLAFLKVPVSGKGTKLHINFRKVLLTKCQHEFQKDVSNGLEKEERLKQINGAKTEKENRRLHEQLKEEKRIANRRSLGNIRFIGELFKLDMLTSLIMHDCVQKLIWQGDEDSLECLCRLLTTIGKDLDTEKSKSDPRVKKEWMDTYFETMEEIVNEGKISCRIRFMLQDVIDLRKRVWVPRRDENNPKTIEQIHREAEQEAQQQQILLQRTINSKHSDYKERRKGRTSNPSLKEWTSVGEQSDNSSNSSKIRTTKVPNEVQNIKLGPGGHGCSMWGEGSSGGKIIPLQETETDIAISNRYSALHQETPFDSSRGMQGTSACTSDSSRGSSNQYVTATARKTSSINGFVNKEREQLSTTANDFRKTPSDEQQTQRKEIRECQEQTDQTSLLRGKDMLAEEMESKTKPLIDELLHIRDVKEATECFLEIASENTVPYFVTAAVSQAVERSNQDCIIVGEFLCKLVCKKFITLDQYIKGFTPILDVAEDLAVDIPRIWEYLAGMIAQMVQNGNACLTFLKDVASPHGASGTAGKLIAHILKAAAKNKYLGKLWRASRKSYHLQWSDFLSPNEDIWKFIEENCLEFIFDIEFEDTAGL